MTYATEGRSGTAKTLRTLKELPGPRGLPLLGNLLQLDLGRLHRVLERWADEFGPLYKFELGRRPLVVVTDPELIQHVLRHRPNVYRRLGTIEPVFQEMGITGVFSAEGENWKRQRRLTAHALDGPHLRLFFPTLLKVTARLRNRWNRAAEQPAGVDVQRDLMRYTVDVTTNLAFGYDMNTLEQEGDVIQGHLEKVFPMLNRRLNVPFPYWRYLRLPADRALDEALAAIRETITGFVTRGRARLAEHPELAGHPTNLLEAMLGAGTDGEAAFTDEEIYGNVFTMLLAGEDTTANSLSWMLHFLIQHPEVESRMRSEAAEVVGPTGLLERLEDGDRLRYLEAVAHETMRLKPVAPLLALESIAEVELGGLRLPAGTALIVLTLHGPLQETHFAAADQFRPERWLEAEPSSTCPHNPRAFVPFGAGPRVCPGRQLAMAEIKSVMALLCTGFEVSRTEAAPPVGERFSFTMMPENLLVRFRRRPSA